tara:strand:+ start:464 stop:643 length:180 start_codon:yes stop_codon:yes gene_type:complete
MGVKNALFLVVSLTLVGLLLLGGFDSRSLDTTPPLLFGTGCLRSSERGKNDNSKFIVSG